MTNNHIKDVFAVQIETTRGTLTIECAAGSKTVGYHYKPIERLDIYMNGPIPMTGHHMTRKKTIRHYLKRSWIDPTKEFIDRVLNSASLVQQDGRSRITPAWRETQQPTEIKPCIVTSPAQCTAKSSSQWLTSEALTG